MRLIIIQLFIFVDAMCTRDYFTRRSRLITAEIQNSLGGTTILTGNEMLVNNCLMQYKFKEIDYAFDHPQYFNLSHNFFEYKSKMRQSKVYKIIQRMPKGAALHLHDKALLGPDYIMNITYMDNLYVCFYEGAIHMKFSNRLPTQECDHWQLMSEARRAAVNITKFDYELSKHFTLVVDKPDVVYPNVREVWKAVSQYFRTVSQILLYKPVWEQYLYDSMKKFRQDNIMYLEIRSSFPILYDLNGNVYDNLVTANIYKSIINHFVKDYPDFIGAKLIFALTRRYSENVTENIQLAHQIKNNVSEIFAGIDFVGPEDFGLPLIDFVPQLLEIKDLDFFFHAGETDWCGARTDENLVDAILLGTKRIGHGYALAKHPLLMKAVVEKDIGLEVNVISNAVLSLVRDMRNHPLSVFLANSLPVVLSSDDPGAWEAEPLSDDFYVAFMGVASKHSDLRLLKTLAKNSLKYSSLDRVKKENALNKFELQWNKFVDEFNCSAY